MKSDEKIFRMPSTEDLEYRIGFSNFSAEHVKPKPIFQIVKTTNFCIF